MAICKLQFSPFFAAHPHTATVAAAILGCRIARFPSRVV
jgi:hypothetical protein